MMDLMKRDFGEAQIDKDRPGARIYGNRVDKYKSDGAKLWSKAGWTSKTRHDAAYIETPDGQKFVFVVFTENFANEREIIPTIAEKDFR